MGKSGADFDAIVVGAGFGGMYTIYKLRDELGLSVQAYENASDVGGTWFWNRYPGALSDTESFAYRYSFDKEGLKNAKWKTRYLTQPEIFGYLQDFATRYDIRRSYQFNTKVTAANFDEAAGLWRVTTDRGQQVTAKYLITGLGLLSATNTPPFKGIDKFKGDIFHTGNWPEGIDLSNKRVGVIGTGSTGVQLIIALAPVVKHLTVLQRSAQYVVPIGNWPEDEARINEYKVRYDEIWEQVKNSVVAFGFEESTVPFHSVSPAEQQQIFENIWNKGGGFRFMFETFSDIATDRDANNAAADFIKRKIAKIVKDPETAKKLMPNDLYAKRPLCAVNYYDVYNRYNVTLKDVKSDPIAEFTERGVRLESGDMSELDVVVFATGFDAVDGHYTRMNLTGREGVSIKEKWSDGPLGYLGMMEAGFPNFFMILGPNGPFTNLPPAIETQVEWFSDAIKMMEENGHATMEPKQAAANEWVETCRDIADMTLFPQAESWIFGANIPGKKNAVMFYLGGIGNYRTALQSVVNDGYSTMMFDRFNVRQDGPAHWRRLSTSLK
jgi:cation diffusion facilitator CzcD-associated flavoprotein CzcO